MENNRASFGSNFGFLMAAIGSAVGLGNIWGFPYKMGMSGGFAFRPRFHLSIRANAANLAAVFTAVD